MSKKMTTSNEEKLQSNYIVGIGASAGGLEALQKLLTALPSNTGFPFIIVQHLSPDYKSLLSEILSKYTKMPVIQVEEGMSVEPNTVYVIQPGKNMRISGGKLYLSSLKEHELNLPIDMFFYSLAKEAGSRSIAVVLSGTGSDGSNGIKAIKESEGLILVQDLETAKFDGMPRSAIRTGIVDAQLSPEQIALELTHISNSTAKEIQELKTEKDFDEKLMKKVYIILKKICNINFAHYKQTTILRRIQRRMILTHMDTLSEYVDYLYESPDEVRTLSKEVLIGVTSFFRDPEFFLVLKEKAIQDIIVRCNEGESIRVWVAGCSTGEEAYSIAILFCEVMETLKIKRNVKIFATDLDVESVNIAGKGVYSDGIIESVSPARLSKFFTRKNNTYVVNRDLRKMIVFSPHNVFQDPPFGKLDLISCRNMLIYFQPVLQNDLFSIFHTSLKDGRYLFLGKSEAIGAFTEAFPVVDAAAKLFTHRADARITGTKTVPFLQTAYFDDDITDDTNERITSRKQYSSEQSIEIDESIDNSLLEQFMPACFVVNDKNEIIHSYGESGNYVHISLGKFSNVIFDVITEALKVPVSTLLKEAREKKQKVKYSNICFIGEREQEVINITALPVRKKNVKGDNLFAIVLTSLKDKQDASEGVPYEIDRIASQRITDLEQELGDVQGKLDKSIAEQECVNEELQAANEELLTANEELQSSNEELQSVNEELYTVNSEYQQKLIELAELNDDIANFLSSTMIGIIFVDNKLNIRRYTDYVTTEFSVMDHDIGRSLKFISYHFPTVDISEICDNVLKTLVPDKREVTTSKNKAFFMRVAPYRSTENKILGCVISFVDITSQKIDAAKLQNTEHRLSILQQTGAAKNEYLSHIVHEIKTPMGVLSGLSKMIKKKASDNPDLSDDLSKIIDTVDYMASIVTEVAAAATNDQLSMGIMERFEIRSVLDNVYALLKPKADKAGVILDFSIDDSFNFVYNGNSTAVQQVIINLLDNAIKYTRRGGSVSLNVFEDEQSTSQKASLKIIVKDTGIGIGKEFLPNIFKPFTRERHDDAKGDGSVGLGLSIANNLVESMGGNITVESELDKGTTFTATILLNRYNALSDSIQSQPNISFAGCKILVAEDNTLNRLILTSVLQSEQISVVEAEDGDVAVELYNESPAKTFDCILMDMRMPKMDGIKATAMIRASNKPDAATIPIIAISANGFAQDIRQAINAGISDYMTKPINKEKLFELLAKHLHKI